MKLLSKISLILLVIYCLSILGCNKYPDGPVVSLRTKKHRLVGEWVVDYFAINGYDSTSYVKSLQYFGKYSFFKTEDSHGRCAFSYVPNTNDYEKIGYWEFTYNKRGVYIHQPTLYPPINFSIGPYGAEDVTWEIRRLKEDELWLQTNFGGKEYFVKFKH